MQSDVRPSGLIFETTIKMAAMLVVGLLKLTDISILVSEIHPREWRIASFTQVV